MWMPLLLLLLAAVVVRLRQQLESEEGVSLPLQEPLAHLAPRQPAARALRGLGREQLAHERAGRAVPPLAHRVHERVMVEKVQQQDGVGLVEGCDSCAVARVLCGVRRAVCDAFPVWLCGVRRAQRDGWHVQRAVCAMWCTVRAGSRAPRWPCTRVLRAACDVR